MALESVYIANRTSHSSLGEITPYSNKKSTKVLSAEHSSTMSTKGERGSKGHVKKKCVYVVATRAWRISCKLPTEKSIENRNITFKENVLHKDDGQVQTPARLYTTLQPSRS